MVFTICDELFSSAELNMRRARTGEAIAILQHLCSDSSLPREKKAKYSYNLMEALYYAFGIDAIHGAY